MTPSNFGSEAVNPAQADALNVTEYGSIQAEEALPGALATPLFDGAKHTYFMFDAARAPGLSEWLGGTGLPHECLFQGDALRDLSDVAPWIVQLTPDAPILKALFTEGEPPMMQLWGAKTGVFLRSDANMKTLTQHLRRMIRVRNAEGAWTYFRFWDPIVAFDYFAKVTDWSERVDSVFTSRHLRDMELLAIHEEHGLARHFHLPTSYAPDPQYVSAPFRLSQRDHDIFATRERPKLKAELADWLLRLDPARFRPFGKQRREAIAEHGLQQGAQFGFEFKEEYAHLLYMMSFLGGWFHTSSDFAAFCAGWTEQPERRYEAMRLGFVDAYQAAYPDPDTRVELLSNIYQRASFIPGGIERAGAADIETLSGLAERLLPAGTSPNQARAETIETCKMLELNDTRVKCLFYILRLALGPRPLDDPFQPWLREKLFASGQRPTNVAKTAEFSLRRLRHLV